MDAATLGMLRSSLTHLLTDDGEAPLSERLTTLGWDEVLEDDAPSALQALFEIRGTTLSGADALGPLLARTIAESVHRPELAGATVVLPGSLHPERLTSRVEGSSLVVAGTATATPAGAPAVVPVGGDLCLALLPATVQWTSRPVGGTDPSMGLIDLAATVSVADCEWIEGRDAWTHCTASARWALAAELVAIGHQVIGGAVDYTGQRKQYGRPIGTFQALQHRLAGAHASVVGAGDVVAEAVASASPWVATIAKAVAGRAAENACTQAQQSYGAIGFTWEHELHRSIRRVYVLDWLFGDWRTLEREIGARLLATGEIPTIGSL
jgi:hypothetical protein